MSKPSVFTKHRATVYTPSSQLRGYLAASMKTWNQSLGTTVFATGTKAHHTITVNFGTGGKDASEWDGLACTRPINSMLTSAISIVPAICSRYFRR